MEWVEQQEKRGKGDESGKKQDCRERVGEMISTEVCSGTLASNHFLSECVTLSIEVDGREDVEGNSGNLCVAHDEKCGKTVNDVTLHVSWCDSMAEVLATQTVLHH